MEKTLRGYLRKTLKRISGMNTLSIARLARAAQRNEELVAPLFLYAASLEREYHLMSKVWGTPLESELRVATQAFHQGESVEDFLARPDIPHAYARVARGYAAYLEGEPRDTAALERLRTRMVNAIAAGGLVRHQICTDLDLNPGNFYAFLRGDTTKLSLATAQRACNHVYKLLEEKQQ